MMSMVSAAANMQLAALILLAFYLTATAVLTPRELAFLRGVEPPFRTKFIVQDVLLQASILLTLLPCTFLPKLNLPAVYCVLAGFFLLWVTAIWAASSRYTYTYRVLLGKRGDVADRLKQIFSEAQQEDRDDA